MGALASGGIQVLDGDLIRRLQVQPYAVDMVIKEEMRELARRKNVTAQALRRRYCAGARRSWSTRLATGLTMRAAVRAARKQQPARIIVAVPVGARRRSACSKRRLTKWCVFARRNHLLPWVCGTRSSARQQTRKFASCWDERVTAIASQAELGN